MDMSIDRKRGNAESLGHDNRCRFVTYAGKFFKRFKGLRYNALMLFDEDLDNSRIALDF
jgi:hypothetical protein